jgi:hypothetical protein
VQAIHVSMERVLMGSTNTHVYVSPALLVSTVKQVLIFIPKS